MTTGKFFFHVSHHDPKLEVSRHVKKKTGRLQSSWKLYNHPVETISTIKKIIKKKTEVILASC